MPRTSNPGAPEGAEIVFLAEPFGGWVSTPTGNAESVHLLASMEGVQGALAKESVNQYAESDGISLHRLEKFGHIAPGNVYALVTDLGSYITDLILNGDADANAKAWWIQRNGRLIQSGAFGGATAAKFDPQMTHTGSGLDHSSHTLLSAPATADADLLLMFDLASTPVQYALWAWEDNTDADISAVNNTGSGELDGWYSAIVAAGSGAIRNLKKGVPHKMCLGPDGNLYIVNGSYVEQVVINGALSAAAAGLELPIGTNWTATGIVSYANYIAVICSSTPNSYNRSKTKVFLWNGLSTTTNGVISVAAQYSYPLPDNFGNGIFYDGATLYALTNGRNNTSKIFEFTGKAFKKVFESGLITPSANAIQGSLESYQDSLMIGMLRNSLGALGRFYGGGFHNEGIVGDGTNTASSIGMVKNLFKNQLFIGAVYGTSLSPSYGVFYNANLSLYQTGAQIRTILYSSGVLGRRMYPLGFKGTVNRLQLYLSQWGTGASLYLSLFKDYVTANPGKTGDLLNILIDTDTGTPNGDQPGTNYFGGTGYRHYTFPVGTTEMDISDIAIPDVSSFYMIVTFSHLTVSAVAANLRRLVAFWQPSQ